MEITFITPNAVVPALAAARVQSVTVSPTALQLAPVCHATRGAAGALGQPTVTGLPVAGLPVLRQPSWNPNPIKVAPIGATEPKNSTTLAYRNQESSGMKLDGFSGLPPRGKPKV
ncbi:hypothetical protein Cme02nite_42450 [Catellatospora methionotrophica]|uniref:Uncharacterized protein n=1 Tax=Catellatospora methionotrophica TaxID=121620 RepID=A0A8J3LD07_9ACTN|nr:hypothetical protein [Catellatospora methionotrophica]GIG15913.1 hypothetical protein Cme02nite_42450 [Catellatospora methionotrophica]